MALFPLSIRPGSDSDDSSQQPSPMIMCGQPPSPAPPGKARYLRLTNTLNFSQQPRTLPCSFSFSFQHRFPESIPPSAALGRRNAAAYTANRPHQIPASRALPDDVRARTRSEPEFVRRFQCPHRSGFEPKTALHPNPVLLATVRIRPSSPDCRAPAIRVAKELHLHVPEQCRSRSTRNQEEADPHAGKLHFPISPPA
jgi:hypothetical protein